MYSVDAIGETPVHTDGKSYKRLLFVQSVTLLRFQPHSFFADPGIEFTNDRAIFDIYVDFRPGQRATWRPWVYAYSNNVRHQLTPLDADLRLGAYSFAMNCGKAAIRRRWWELLAKRFPDTRPCELIT